MGHYDHILEKLDDLKLDPRPDGIAAYVDAISNPVKDPNDPAWPLPSFSAKDWAEAFCKRHPDMDPDIMLGWFANALMRGYDEAIIRMRPDGM